MAMEIYDTPTYSPRASAFAAASESLCRRAALSSKGRHAWMAARRPAAANDGSPSLCGKRHAAPSDGRELEGDARLEQHAAPRSSTAAREREQNARAHSYGRELHRFRNMAENAVETTRGNELPGLNMAENAVETTRGNELPGLSTLLRGRQPEPRLLRDAASHRTRQNRDGVPPPPPSSDARSDSKAWAEPVSITGAWHPRDRAASSVVGPKDSVRELYATLSHADRVSRGSSERPVATAAVTAASALRSPAHDIRRELTRSVPEPARESPAVPTTSHSSNSSIDQEIQTGAKRRKTLSESDPSMDDDAESCQSRDSASPSSLLDQASSFIKSSRYLREMDRRVILKRLANGEKQATLAKEFQVSRAAICNLFKHRHEIMSRTNENPFAKHPKKRKHRKPSDASAPPVPASPRRKKSEVSSAPTALPALLSSAPARSGPLSMTNLHEIKSRPIQLLLTILRDPSTLLAEFRRCCDRVLRLVIEEALAVVATQTIDVALTEHRKISGIGPRHPPCAISMEQRHCPMVDLFHLLEPNRPVGYVRLSPSYASRGTTPEIHFLDADLPLSLARHNVFLFDLVMSSGETMCAVIERVKQRGAVECMIHVVSLLAAADAVAMVQQQHPSVKIVVAQVGLSSETTAAEADGVLQRFEQVFGDAVGDVTEV
ncbi:hypothetical protein ATCC90586_002561 [Pythium insidiosum]|nr:hypothetical protein ATCC90586_002561 [Pythium insidiosum]